MSYTKTVWNNGSGAALNATNLNKIEDGIKVGFDHSETVHAPSNADNTAANETDPVFRASSAYNITAQDITDLSNLSGINTGDQDLSTYQTKALSTLKQHLTTGFVSGLVLTINVDPTKFNIAAGQYVITDYADPLNNVPLLVDFAAVSGITPLYLNSANATYIALDGSSNIVQKSSPFTASERRAYCLIGAVIHSNRSTINVINEIKAPIVGDSNQLHDLMKIIGSLNIEGNVYSANGSNLAINKSSGTIFGLGINAHDYTNPHVKTIAAQTMVSFRYRLRDGTEYADVTTLNPTQWDNNGVLATVDNNKFTVQHIHLFQSGITRIQYGQTQYDSIADAKAFAATSLFVTEQNIAENSIFRAYLIMKKETLNLTDAITNDTAYFIVVDKFGSIVGGSAATLTLDSLLAALGYTPEDAANKQNSLAVDGTGAKYPTVDGVSSALALKAPLASPAFTGTPTYEAGWKDNIQPFSAAKGNGTTEPVWDDMGNGIFSMLFTAGDELMVDFHVDHDYKVGSLAYPHVHWLSTAPQATGNTTVWEISYIIAKGHAQGQSLTSALTTFNVTHVADGTEIAGEHIVTECSDLQAFSLIEPDTVVCMKVKLLSTTAPGNIFGLMADLHYLADRETTINKAPNFYV